MIKRILLKHMRNFSSNVDQTKRKVVIFGGSG